MRPLPATATVPLPSGPSLWAKMPTEPAPVALMLPCWLTVTPPPVPELSAPAAPPPAKLWPLMPPKPPPPMDWATMPKARCPGVSRSAPKLSVTPPPLHPLPPSPPSA